MPAFCKICEIVTKPYLGREKDRKNIDKCGCDMLSYQYEQPIAQ